MHPTHVVLDCDTANEVDDQFAIANALGMPEGTLDVRGVISVHNTPRPTVLARATCTRRKPKGWSPCARATCPVFPARSARWRAGGAGAERGPRVPGGRSAPEPADRYRHGTGDGRRIATSGSAGVAGERARRLARRVRGRSQLQYLAE